MKPIYCAMAAYYMYLTVELTSSDYIAWSFTTPSIKPRDTKSILYLGERGTKYLSLIVYIITDPKFLTLEKYFGLVCGW